MKSGLAVLASIAMLCIGKDENIITEPDI